MDISNCPHWQKCSAPICPLDSDIHDRRHLRGEPICFYLREYVKTSGKARIRGRLTTEYAEAIGRVYPRVIARWPDIRRQLERSAKTGSRLGRQPVKASA